MLPIDEPTRQRVRASFAPFLAERERYSTEFYERLFAAAPHLRGLFADDLAALRRKFVDMLVVVIDAAIGGPASRLLEELGARHVAYGARAEHYPVVHRALLATLRSADPAFEPETERAWGVVLQHIIAAMLRGAAHAVEGSEPFVLVVRQPTPDRRWIVHDDAAGRTLSVHESRALAEAAAIRFAEAAARSGRIAKLLFHHENGAIVRFQIGA